MKEAYLYKKLKEKKVQCQTCAHYCLLKNNEIGKCGVRKNIEGKLYALNYQKVIALNVDPIEKKPLYHFLPGSYSLSLATVGCNFSCLNCQNWDISQGFKNKKEIPGEEISPQKIVQIALEKKIPSISYTYTEPTIFLEYALEIMKLAKKRGIKNVFVSNGFMSKESLEMVLPYLDANNIDLKGFSEEFYQKVCGAKLGPVLETIKTMKKNGIWVEITTLAIPTLSDSEKMFQEIANWIFEELGPEIPWHISRFSGKVSWQLQHFPDTPLEVLEKAFLIGKKRGLKYVYLGNVFGHQAENTYCPKCYKIVIKRSGYSVLRLDKNGICPFCQEKIDLILNQK
jgi:pyruvate formate lyase activating enzyme